MTEVLILTVMATKSITCSKDFRLGMGLREEGKKMRNKGEKRIIWNDW